MKLFFVILIYFNSLAVLCQRIEVAGGMNRNIFYDLRKEDPHFTSTYNPGWGYVIKAGIQDVKVDWLTLKITLEYDNYIGQFKASHGGLGGRWYTSANTKKSVISLGLFPLNFEIRERIELNFGMEMSRLIREDFKGKKGGWILIIGEQFDKDPIWSYALEAECDEFNSKYYFGFKASIAYKIDLGQSLYLKPEYSWFIGTSEEFLEFPTITKSMRHYLCIGIGKKLDSSKRFARIITGT